MAPPDRAGSIGADVSPELIAAITKRVKQELVEHLKQTGTIEDHAPPLQRAPSNRSASTSSETARRVYTPPSPAQAPKQAAFVPQPTAEPIRSPPASPLDKPSNVRFSDRTPRPTAGTRSYSTVELSTIDQKWGRLFDNDGTPTQRLGQFLRGLANHIIEDFTPKKSIVLTPTKMAAYYADHPLENEIHPLLSIFKVQRNEQISRLYQDLGCQHHLVQENSSMTPTIPALTPVGFAHWMTIHLLAYPDLESRRLEKVVLALPIDADGPMIDGKPERLPKQISRHLLPGKADEKSKLLVENAISNFFEDLGSSSRRKPTISPPPISRHTSMSQSRPRPVEIHQVRTSPTASKAQPIERERNPYTGAPSTASDTSSNEDSIQIERERQPYTAQPGNGKIYAEASSSNSGPRAGRKNSMSRTRPSAETIETRHHRTQSTASQGYVPPPRAGGRRTSSPPLKKYSDSTPIDIGAYKPGPPLSSTSSSFSQPNPFTPSSYGPGYTIPPPPPLDSRDRRREDRHRRGTGEDARMTEEFSSPRDAERWDRLQESRAAEMERPDRLYEKREPGSIGTAYEDWYREPPSGRDPGYDERRY